MKIKYQFPMHLFLTFEKITPVVYTSECLTINHYVIILPKEWYFSFNKGLKFDSISSLTTLIEQSAVDVSGFSNFNDKFFLDLKQNPFFFYNVYYSYSMKTRCSIFTKINKSNGTPSIESLFYNASWLERETSEMYGIAFNFKKDIRNLLLDYSKNEYPLLKDFPVEGYNDAYYDFFEENVQYCEYEFIEL